MKRKTRLAELLFQRAQHQKPVVAGRIHVTEHGAYIFQIVLFSGVSRSPVGTGVRCDEGSPAGATDQQLFLDQQVEAIFNGDGADPEELLQHAR